MPMLRDRTEVSTLFIIILMILLVIALVKHWGEKDKISDAYPSDEEMSKLRS